MPALVRVSRKAVLAAAALMRDHPGERVRGGSPRCELLFAVSAKGGTLPTQL